MFRPPWTWHQRSCRRFCRTVFVTMCVLPTAVVLTWAVTQHLPGTHTASERRLSLQLGLRATAERVTRPRYGIVRWHGLTLADPETGQRLLTFPQIESAATAEGLVLHASQATIDVDRAERLWPLVSGLLRQTDAPTVRLSVRDFLLVYDGREHLVHDVQARVQPLANGAQAHLCFRADEDDEDSDSTRLSAVRNRQTTPPSTLFELRTGETALPCSLLAVLWPTTNLWPTTRHFGSESKFRGFVWATRQDHEWDGELAGELTDVDLGHLLSPILPGQISATARLSVERARIGGGRLMEATGRLSAGPATISREFFARATAALRLVSALSEDNLSEQSRSQRSVDQLALSFTIGPDGLSLRGTCADAPDHTVVVSHGRPALFTAQQHRLSVAALVQLLAPSATLLGPMSAEVQRLARILPLPATSHERVATHQD